MDATRLLKRIFRIPKYTRKSSHKSEDALLPTALPNPTKITSDMIGPVDPVSNLRRIIFRRFPDETILEKRFREKRNELQDWNQKFWSKHNTNFFQEKEKFTKNNISAENQALSPDEMSVFYKAFLDKNWKTHVEYNKLWYRNNVELLFLAIRVKLQQIFNDRRK